MNVEAIELYISNKKTVEKETTIQFRKRDAIKGIFVKGKDYDELKQSYTEYKQSFTDFKELHYNNLCKLYETSFNNTSDLYEASNKNSKCAKTQKQLVTYNKNDDEEKQEEFVGKLFR